MGGDVESALQNTAKMISTVKPLSWTKWMENLDLPPTPSNQGWENGMFWFSRGFILDFSLFGGGGGVGGGGGGGSLLIHDLLPSREGCWFLGVGIALLHMLHFRVFYGMVMHDNEFATKEKKFITKTTRDFYRPQHLHHIRPEIFLA